MQARTVKHRIATLFAALLCAAPAGAFAQLNGSGQYAHGLQEPSLTRPETWLKGGNAPDRAVDPAVNAERVIAPAPALAESGVAAKFESATPLNAGTGAAPKPETALLPYDADITIRENDSEHLVPRGAREAARDPCLRSSDPKCYERHKDDYHPYLGYRPGPTSVPPVGSTTARGAGGVVGSAIMPASEAATPQKLEQQPLVFFDPPPKKQRRGK
jgi:hypothetical protein